MDNLRGDLYKQFGVQLPGVKFYKDERDLSSHSFRIKFLDQRIEEVSPKLVSQDDQALPEIMEALHLRCAANRTSWLSPEHVYVFMKPLPSKLRSWLDERYSLTDLKIIFRVLLDPPEPEEANLLAGQTVRYPSWLLGSLIFWTNLPDSRKVKQISSKLRDTQLARLKQTSAEIPRSRISDLVRRGLDDLNKDNCEKAARLFKEAIDLDPDAATSAFLALYARQPEVTLERKLRRIEQTRPLPGPGEVSRAKRSSYQDRYEIEELLEQSGPQLSPKRRRFLEFCLVNGNLALGFHEDTKVLFDQLLSGRGMESWNPEEEYFLAYHLLSAHNQGLIPLPNLDQVQALLSNSFRKWNSNKQADAAFSELAKLSQKSSTSCRFWDMMDHLAEFSPRSFSIPYSLGLHYVDSGPTLVEKRKALVLFDRAEGNIKDQDSTGKAALSAGLARL